MYYENGDSVTLSRYALLSNGLVWRGRIRTRVKHAEMIPKGFLGSFKKAFVELGLRGNRRTAMLLKHEPRAIDTYRKYLSLQKAGIPVAKHFRLVDDNTIAVNDLRTEGIYLFGKAMEEVMEMAMKVDHPFASLAQRYLSAIPANIYRSFLQETDNRETIQSRLQSYADRATVAGISLPAGEEGFELGVRQQSPAEFIFLDISSVNLNLSQTVAQQHNASVVQETLADIGKMRSWIHTYTGSDGGFHFPDVGNI